MTQSSPQILHELLQNQEKILYHLQIRVDPVVYGDGLSAF